MRNKRPFPLTSDGEGLSMSEYPSYATPFPRRLMCASAEAGILAPTGASHLVATVAGQRRTLTGFPRCAPCIRALEHLCRSDIRLWREYNTRRMGCQIKKQLHTLQMSCHIKMAGDLCSSSFCSKITSVRNRDPGAKVMLHHRRT